MSDFIEREPVAIFVEECGCSPKWIAERIRNQEAFPAADVAPVRHGHWNDINPAVLKPGVNWVCRCSECGCPQDYKHNYCPSCGARMDKEGNT